MDSQPRILVLDIETKPAKAYVWRFFKENISVDQVIEPGGMICFGAQWMGSNEVMFFSEWQHGEVGMAQAAANLLEEADAVVTFNGDTFDLPKINTSMILAGIPPRPPITTIDLKKVLFSTFGFDSNRLVFIAPLLGVGKKVKHEGFELWTKVMNGNEAARKKMERYCKQDVRVTGRLYKKLRPYITNHPAFRSLGSTACPKCLSKNTVKKGLRHTACYQIQRHKCNGCGGWFQGTRRKVA